MFIVMYLIKINKDEKLINTLKIEPITCSTQNNYFQKVISL